MRLSGKSQNCNVVRLIIGQSLMRTEEIVSRTRYVFPLLCFFNVLNLYVQFIHVQFYPVTKILRKASSSCGNVVDQMEESLQQKFSITIL